MTVETSTSLKESLPPQASGINPDYYDELKKLVEAGKGRIPEAPYTAPPPYNPWPHSPYSPYPCGCTCNQPLLMWIPPGSHTTIYCPVHGYRIVYGGPAVWC